MSGCQFDEGESRSRGSDRTSSDRTSDDVLADKLADKLLAVQRVLSTFSADSDARIRLNLRFMAICTSLKVPGANALRGMNRLDRLMADAKLLQRGKGKEV